jgi:hypothetical protein
VTDAAGSILPVYRDFLFPLNVLTHVIAREEGDVPYLHYGLFEGPGEPMGIAQERSTALVVSRLPRPPHRVLEVGIGFGTVLERLLRMGYDAEGVTPDPIQASIARSRCGNAPLHVSRFETFECPRRFGAFLFQESSQYIDSEALFERARLLAAPHARLLVVDEFALRPLDAPDALHRLDRFLMIAAREEFQLEEELDLSKAAAPTIDYFLERLPRHREALVAELGVTSDQLETLAANGRAYRERYAAGDYGYRLLTFAQES